MTEVELKESYEDINRFWKFLRKYYKTENSDEFWHNCVEESVEAINECHNKEFAKNMCFAILSLISETAIKKVV